RAPGFFTFPHGPEVRLRAGGLSHRPFYLRARIFMLRCGTFELTLDRPLLMGIVNLTPDSFSGDGLASDTARAVARAHAQIEAGADLLDLGAESSRPGAIPTPVDE